MVKSIECLKFIVLWDRVMVDYIVFILEYVVDYIKEFVKSELILVFFVDVILIVYEFGDGNLNLVFCVMD